MDGDRASMLIAHIQRHPDPETSRDPRIQHLLAELRTVDVAPGPEPVFRDELRRQLVAIAPRLIAEGEHAHGSERRPLPVRTAAKHLSSVPATTTAAPVNSPPSHARTRPTSFARPLRRAVTVAAAFAVILGGATWMSQKSLPGDALYSLKRASERVELSFAGDDVSRAREYLDLAQTRVAEAQALIHRTTASGAGLRADGVSAATSSLITSTLGSADTDVRQAWTLLATRAAKSNSATPLAPMLTWAPGQYQRLRDLSAAMPTRALRHRADTSAGVVQGARESARILQANIDCHCLDIAKSNYTAPRLCQACSTSTQARTGASRSGTRPGGHPVGSASVPQRQLPATSLPPRSTTAPQRAASSASAKRTRIPALPSVKITLPVASTTPIAINSCSVTVGPLGVPLPCPSSR